MHQMDIGGPSRKIRESLEQQGIQVSRKTVARILKELDLKSK